MIQKTQYIYNPFGLRLVKINMKNDGSVGYPEDDWSYSYYAYDANGQVLAIYSAEIASNSKTASINEKMILGQSRIGLIKPKGEASVLFNNGLWVDPNPDYSNSLYAQTQYELTNYLGNVNAVISDKRLAPTNSSQSHLDILMTSDYFPFGMPMADRQSNSESYRYGYNGMEMDNEASGTGNSYTTEFRQYDPRLARWKSLDPLMMKFPWMSPYVAFDNNPVFYTDPYGLEATNDGEDNCEGGDDDKIYDSGKTQPEVTVSAKKLPKAESDQNKTDALNHTNGKEDKKYDDWRGSEAAYRHSMDLMSNNTNSTKYMETRIHPNNYKEYGWSRFDPNVVTNEHYNQFELEQNWMYDAPGFCNMVGKGVNGLMFGLAGGFIANASLPFLPSALNGATWAGRTYHYTFGINGGYKSFLFDGMLQSAYGGDYNFTSGVTSLFLLNSTSIYARIMHQYVTNLAPVNIDGIGKQTPLTYMEAMTLDNLIMDVYGKSKWGTPYLAIYWQLIHYRIIGDLAPNTK